MYSIFTINYQLGSDPKLPIFVNMQHMWQKDRCDVYHFYSNGQSPTTN